MSRQVRERPEPLWISRNLLDAMHADLVERYGGSRGILDDGLIESALARLKHLLAYEVDCDLADLAASLAFGIAKNHGYADGNKRTAFVAASVFLRLNKRRLAAGEAEAVVAMVCLATGRWKEKRFARWIRERI